MARKRQKTVEMQGEKTNLGVPRLYPAKTGKIRFTNGSRARGVCFLLDFSVYLFVAPNGRVILVFGHCPFCMRLDGSNCSECLPVVTRQFL